MFCSIWSDNCTRWAASMMISSRPFIAPSMSISGQSKLFRRDGKRKVIVVAELLLCTMKTRNFTCELVRCRLVPVQPLEVLEHVAKNFWTEIDKSGQKRNSFRFLHKIVVIAIHPELGYLWRAIYRCFERKHGLVMCSVMLPPEIMHVIVSLFEERLEFIFGSIVSH